MVDTVPSKRTLRMRQVVDWSAAFWAGLIAGTIFLLLNVFAVPAIIGGSPAVVLNYFASLIMGDSVLANPDTLTATTAIVAIILNFVLSIPFALLLAVIIHRWGIIVGIILGALFGFGLYIINFFISEQIFPWFFAMDTNWFIVTHVIFGALAGGIYEALEVERFVPDED
ncbi:hypothetical protein G4Y79_21635 [Phototrophicus methaneseepsis]|uniref:Uncharacterized protein n=1 Tax=Phototrophicus methaneseepsis TaxID=2710758 RepID=A0A7S8E8C9_9CHLR|nr:hypothetical protein [Phototrophicus methaneseepsis]QPC82254.1 hypothetical protein G4Y79_21635 [Phototrophicus methaneseepsis]